MKIFQIGFNKCGTCSFFELFDKAVDPKLKCVHWDKGALAESIYRNDLSGKKLLEGKYEDYNFYSDMEGSFLEKGREHWVFVYLDYFKKIDEQYPNSKFILNIRPKNKWILSRINHIDNKNNGKITYYIEKHIEFYKVNLNKIIELWSKQFDEHINNVKIYFKDRPNDLLIFDIENDNFSKVKEFFPNIEFFHQEIPHLNKTSDTKLWCDKQIKRSDNDKANT